MSETIPVGYTYLLHSARLVSFFLLRTVERAQPMHEHRSSTGRDSRDPSLSHGFPKGVEYHEPNGRLYDRRSHWTTEYTDLKLYDVSYHDAIVGMGCAVAYQ